MCLCMRFKTAIMVGKWSFTTRIDQPSNAAALTASMVKIFSAMPLSTLVAGGVFLLPEDGSEIENDEDLCDAVDIILKVIVDNFSQIIRAFLVEKPPDVQSALAFLRFYFVEDAWKMAIWSCVLGKLRNPVHTFLTCKTVTVNEVCEHRFSRLLRLAY